MKRLLLTIIFIVAVTISTFAQTKKIETIYTSLDDKACKTIESNPNEGGSYRGMCLGVGGYKLELLEGDIRQTINIITPKKKRYELELWTVVSSAFSFVGQKAEWRVTRKGQTITPIALIIRFNASKSPDTPEVNNSFLAIAKITKNSACVTDVVEPTVKNQNAVARQLADASANKPCKSVE